MKKIIATTLLAVGCLAAFAQGTVNFANGAAGVNAPVFDVGHSGSGLLGPNFVAQLYGGAQGTSAGSLVAQGSPVAFSTSVAGYFFAPSPVAVSGVSGGSVATLQVRVWNINNGATFEAASAVVGAHIGQSGTVDVTLVTSPNPPNNMVGLQGFDLVAVVPEPSTVALGFLGAAALFLRRRKA